LDAPRGLGETDATGSSPSSISESVRAVGYAERTPSGRGGGHAWFGRLLIGLAATAAIAIGVGSVVVLHGHKHASGPPAAEARTLPSRKLGLTGILAVLRRPQTAADLNLALLQRLERRSSAPLAALQGTPVLSLVRLATVTPWGEQVFLVPTRPLTHNAIAKRMATPKLSAVVRRNLLRRLARQDQELTLGIDGTGGATAAEIEAGADWISGGPSSNTLVLVVPDGVARVTVQLLHPVSAIVHNNVAAFEVPQPIENLGVYKMTWYSASGAIVKRTGPSIPGSVGGSGAREAAIHASLVRKDERSTARIAPQLLRRSASSVSGAANQAAYAHA
jgi:hypothetical protein